MLDAIRRLRLRIRAALRQARGKARFFFGRLVARLLGPRKSSTALVPRQISTVLVCRINGRMGNTVFLTPLLRRIHELLPDAAIDLALSYPQADALIRNFPGLRRIIAFPHKGPRLVQRYLAALRAMRSELYDLAIDPVPESTSGRVALSLCRARYRVGFATDSQWAPLTHAVPQARGLMHQARQPVFLLSRAFDAPYDPAGVLLTLSLSHDEIEAGRFAVTRAIEAATGMPSGTTRGELATGAVAMGLSRVFGFFAYATAQKTLGRAWWRTFWDSFRELQPEAIPLEFLPGPDVAPIDPSFASLHFPSPRDLTAAIAATRLFICADTGPMHLASSTSVPTVALFQASDPALYGPLKSSDRVINVSERSPREVAQQCQHIWLEALAEQAG